MSEGKDASFLELDELWSFVMKKWMKGGWVGPCGRPPQPLAWSGSRRGPPSELLPSAGDHKGPHLAPHLPRPYGSHLHFSVSTSLG